MASRDWHRMNTLVSEIEIIGSQISDAMVHVMLNKHSVLKPKIVALREKKNRLIDNVYDLATEMLGKIQK